MIVLFESGLSGKYYVSLAMEHKGEQPEILPYTPSALTLIETMMSSSTFLNVKFTDGLSELINSRTIIPDNKFSVTYGNDKDTAKTSDFKLSKLDINQTNSTDMDSIFVKSDMVHSKWEHLFKNNVSRSWKNKSYSYVVEEIIKEMGITSYDIEETKDKFDILQPNWNNNQMLKWLASNSVSRETSVGGYVFYFKLDGSFVFKSLNALYGQSPVNEFTFSGATQGEGGFNFLEIDNSYMPTLINGGFGVKYEYFDYDTKKYVQNEKKITDIDERQLSDWYYIPESHNEASKLYYGGRDVNSADVVENIVLNSSSSVQKMRVTLLGDTETTIGDIINIIIPVSKKILNNNAVINEVYSGYWLVWKITHNFDLQNGTYSTTLYISRNGVNGKTSVGLIKTKTGKDIT